jgi:hypothetical protein
MNVASLSQLLRRRPAEPGEISLSGLGPEAGDPFRFTWWNAADGARVWVEVRGSWRQGVIVSRGRKSVEVEVESAGDRHRRVTKLYSELRRR